MTISRRAPLRAAGALCLVVLAAGCARSPAAPAGARVASTSAPANATPPAQEPREGVVRPARLDPGEEITPDELKTIPEPVPAPAEGGGVPTPRAPVQASQSAPARAGAAVPGSLWRIQVFATQDRELADRTAREAAQLLHCRVYVDSEASHFKVRLGDFDSEQAAGALRDQALRAGYSGAFRIRCPSNTTLNKD